MGILNSHSHQTLLLFYVCRIYEYRITRTTQEKLFGKLETRTECYIEWMTRFIPKLRRSCEASERGKIDIGCCDEESSQTFVPTICFRGGTTLDYCHQDGTVIILSMFWWSTLWMWWYKVEQVTAIIQIMKSKM